MSAVGRKSDPVFQRGHSSLPAAPEQQEQLQEGMGFDSEPLSGFGIWQVFMQPKLVLNLLRGLVFCQLDTISVVPGFLLFL